MVQGAGGRGKKTPGGGGGRDAFAAEKQKNEMRRANSANVAT
jgi:hypothetical protein